MSKRALIVIVSTVLGAIALLFAFVWWIIEAMMRAG